MKITVAAEFTTVLLKQYGLYEKGWRFKLSRGKRTLGECVHFYKRIKISRHHIENGTDAEIIDTIVHEIAHALTPGHHHDWLWRQKARELGAKPRACTYNLSYELPHRAEIRCDIHGVLSKRYRRMKTEKLARVYCKRCGKDSIGQLTQVIFGG